MATADAHTSFLQPILVFCAAAVIAVPLFRRLGQSAVIGYLAAGVVIGPSALSLVGDPQVVSAVAEVGVVLLLFIVGLELKVSQLLSMRRDIFGVGLAQVALTATLLAAVAVALGVPGIPAGILGTALALSATSVALQMLEERGELQAPYGQRAFSVLLFQDLSIVAILAVLPLLATARPGTGTGAPEAAAAVGIAAAALAATILVGRYGLNPFFRLLASSGAREVMTASALLVVLGTALAMNHVGLSMAMGAFLAGLLLAESNFRHQLEADIEPFRGILLGLFFMSVGMSIDLALVRAQWLLLAVATPAVVLMKIAVVALLLRATRSGWPDALRAGALLAPAGEFAFVILPVAAGLGLLAGATAQLATALAALTMLVGPPLAKAIDALVSARARRDPGPAADDFAEAGSAVLVVGFGRFGQIVNQVLLAKGVEVTVIDNDVDQIRSAARFGIRVYYGDGTRLDILRAAGAERAKLICICVDDRDAALKIADIAHMEFRQARTYARAYDRNHAIELMDREVDYQLRETVESALAFAGAALQELGLDRIAAAEVVEDVRKHDVARLVLQQAEGVMAGADLVRTTHLTPEPLTAPKAPPRALTRETRDIIGEDRRA